MATTIIVLSQYKMNKLLCEVIASIDLQNKKKHLIINFHVQNGNFKKCD